MNKPAFGLLVALMISAAGCKSKLNSSLVLNGAPFVPTQCNSGQPQGFSGVDLIDATGTKLRLQTVPTGQAMVFVFPGGSPVGAPVAMCGTLAVERQNSQINNVYNVRGNATLPSCSNGAMTVSGTIQFENCH